MKHSEFIAQLRSPDGLRTGTGVIITMSTLIAVYSLSMVTSLSGLAVSPILAQIQKAFPAASQLEIQMLESLPALIIIPFILFAGKLSERFDRRTLILTGLSIFAISSIINLLPVGINILLANSIFMGIGAGMVIPLSTGMIAYYFAGKRRTQQLGIASAIANLSLVLATAMAGYLAGIEWRLSFAVYTLSFVALLFARKIPHDVQSSVPKADLQPQINAVIVKKAYLKGLIKTDWPLKLMIFYWVMTTAALAVPFNLSVYMDYHHIGSSAMSGTLISVFFLAIMLPGFFINSLITSARERNNLIWIGAIIVGLITFLFPDYLMAIIGVTLIGLGYGVIQPLIYDRTAEQAAPERTTFHLALVMSMNYLAIILYPFVQGLLETIFHSQSPLLPFIMSLVVALIYWIFDVNHLFKFFSKSRCK